MSGSKDGARRLSEEIEEGGGDELPRRLGGGGEPGSEPAGQSTVETGAGLPMESVASDTAGMPAANDRVSAPGRSFETLLSDVPLEVTVELGRVTLPLKEVGERLGPGSLIPLSKLTGESLDIRVNDRLVARAEAIAIGERYGVRIVEIVERDG